MARDNTTKLDEAGETEAFLDRTLLSEFVRLAEDGVVAIDADQKIIFFNRGAERIFGYRASDVLRQSLELLLPQLPVGRHAKHVADFAASSDESRTMSKRARVMGKRADASLFPAEVSISRLHHRGQNVFAAVVRDASDRVRDEQRFRSIVEGTAASTGTRFFHSLVKSLASALDVRYAAVGVLMSGRSPRVRNLAAWSDGAFGPDIEYEILRNSPCDHLVKEEFAFWSDLPGTAVSALSRFLPFTPKSFLGMRLDNAAHQPIGVIIAVDDKTMSKSGVSNDMLSVFGARAASEIERMRAHTALEESEAGTRSLIEGAPYGIYCAAVGGQLLHANPALVRMLGFESEEKLLAEPLQHASFLTVWDTVVSRTLRADRTFPSVEREWRRKDGSPITVRLSGRIVLATSAHGEECEVFVEDISERRALEETLRRAQTMEALGQLTGGIAHDFNNLLTIVQCAAASLELSAPVERQDLRVEIEEIAYAAKRGADLVRNLLAFGRMSRLDARPLDLSRLINDTMGMLRRIIPPNIEIVVDAKTDLPAVRADAGAMQHTLLNLAKNSADAMPDGGTLTLRVQRETESTTDTSTIGASAPKEFVSLAVTDTGAGMDPATQARVFEPFFTTKETGRGSGLGLAMVYGIVRQHGGDIRLESTLGRGTTFTILLPAEQTPSAASESGPTVAEALETAKGGSETILFVDDEEGIRRSARRVLEERGYRVLTAGNGHEALAVIAKHEGEIDLIISDVVMPRMSGPDFFAVLKKRGGVPRFLFTSGNAERFPQGTRSSVDRALPMLRKPWSGAELLQCVREQLNESWDRSVGILNSQSVAGGGSPPETPPG
jgi:PAS domain S-box-containing protein